MENLCIKTVEMHTGGGPVRIVHKGLPEIKGDTILEKMDFFKENLDHIRQFLILEPRGHRDMYGAVSVVPDHPDADAAFFFLQNNGYGTMCGHATIAISRYCVDQKIVKYNEPETQVNIQCPCGLVKAFVSCSNQKTKGVWFHSVPAFVLETNLLLNIDGYGKISVDVSYGGAFYAFVNINVLNLNFSNTSTIADAATLIRKALTDKLDIQHPNSLQPSNLYGVIFTNGTTLPADDPMANLCVFGQSQVDRSPCGSGVTARMALLHYTKKVSIGQKKNFENPNTKSRFTAKVVDTTKCGKYDAVTIEVAGEPFYTGEATFTAEMDDALSCGFLLN